MDNNPSYYTGRDFDIVHHWQDEIIHEISTLDNDLFQNENHEAKMSLNILPDSIAYLLLGPLTILTHLRPIITVVILTRIVHLGIDLRLSNSKWLKHLSTCLFGCWQLGDYITHVMLTNSIVGLFLVSGAIVFYLLHETLLNSILKTAKKIDSRGQSGLSSGHLWISSFVILAPVLLNEYLIHLKSYQDQVYMRSILMTLAMKQTSRIFNRSPKENLLSSLAYLIHPASCIFGPWHLNELETQSNTPENSSNEYYLVMFRKQVKRSCKVFIQALSILLISTNLSDLIVSYLDDFNAPNVVSKPIIVYMRAQDFRFSHYFISYLTVSFLTLWNNPEDERKIEVCKLSKIEWPRSLVQVVVCWNMTMHNWLKIYVFIPIKSRTSSVFTAVLITYTLSSTLHGFKFHIWSVLLSLGLLTWVEHEFRRRLAIKLNACVLAKECTYTNDLSCSRKHTLTSYNSYMVRSINFAFRLLAIAHLAYLGYIFEGNTDEASYKDAMDCWYELYFYSHALALITYMFCKLLPENSKESRIKLM